MLASWSVPPDADLDGRARVVGTGAVQRIRTSVVITVGTDLTVGLHALHLPARNAATIAPMKPIAAIAPWARYRFLDRFFIHVTHRRLSHADPDLGASELDLQISDHDRWGIW